MNMIGIINFPIYERYLENNRVLLLFLIGLVGFVFGALLFRVLKLNIKETEPKFSKTKLIRILFYFWNFFAFILITLTTIRNGGFIILQESTRFKTFAITTLVVYFAIIMTMVYYANRFLENKRIGLLDILFLISQCILILSLGYRSPIISLLGGLFVIFYSIRNDHQNRFKKIFSWKVISGALVFLVAMSYIASFRVSQKYNVEDYFRNIDRDVLEKHPYLEPIVPAIALFRFDQEVVDKLIKKTGGDPMYLGLAASNILTLMPGEQLGARNIIGELTGAPKTVEGKPWSITPTLQGALFVDGSYFFVFFGFFLTALIMEYLRKLIIKKKNPFTIALYGLSVIAFLKCIHTGYLDVSFYIIIFLLFVMKFLVYNVNYRIPKTAG